MANNLKTDKARVFLHNQIEEYVEFVNQVINDEDFLRCIRELLPFDKMANASMTILPEKQMIRKMGVNVMRMDFEPALFSLAVSITVDTWEGQLQEYIFFLTACKTITELQDYVKGSLFREQVTEQFSKKIPENYHNKYNNCHRYNKK